RRAGCCCGAQWVCGSFAGSRDSVGGNGGASGRNRCGARQRSSCTGGSAPQVYRPGCRLGSRHGGVAARAGAHQGGRASSACAQSQQTIVVCVKLLKKLIGLTRRVFPPVKGQSFSWKPSRCTPLSGARITAERNRL